MKKIVFISLLLISLNAFTQEDRNKVFITIDDREITLGEFERVYNKNNSDAVTEKQSVEEYLDMFINYKLKVIEAENMGMDTTQKFIKEFNAYRDQLAKPYLTSEEIREKYAREAYERMSREVNASHILIRVDKNAPPEDTAYAYGKIISIRKRILDGENFETVARATSEDPSVRQNGGNVGWFSAFRMVYPFETTAYNTPVGEISMPVRTAYGYHIVRVNDTRPARGRVRVSHIFLRTPESMPEEETLQKKELIFTLYDSLQSGANFEALARRHTDDESTASHGGLLPWFNSGQMIAPFEDAAFALENKGDISEPVNSGFGWHIIKLVDRDAVESYEEERPSLMQEVMMGDRKRMGDEDFIDTLKKEYNYRFYEENYIELLSRVDTSVLNASWDPERAADLSDQPIFTLDGETVTLEGFIEYLGSRQMKRQNELVENYVKDQYNKYESDWILEYEKANLPEKYPDYRYLVQEYHDGILLFDLTDEVVWTRAVEDTAGLEAYFNNHRDEYLWEKRAEAVLVTVKDSSLLQPARELTDRFGGKRKFSQSFMLEKLCPEDTTQSCLELTEVKHEKGENEELDATGWNEGLSETFIQEGNPAFYFVKGILEPSRKALNETRGMVTADYQEYLEKKWIEQLREKYEINVNRELLSRVEVK